MEDARTTMRTIIAKVKENTFQYAAMTPIECSHVATILNLFEEMAIALKHKAVCPEVMEDQFHGVLKATWGALSSSGYVDHRRNVTGKTTTWVSVEDLNNQW